MNPNRKVLVHTRWRRFHELHKDGTTRCGNATFHPENYQLMTLSQLLPGDRLCERCRWIVKRRPDG
jgi:hypothetical protein